ncbi:hypothetical protein ACFL6Y_06880 [Elusimicrobiota bacterium]
MFLKRTLPLMVCFTVGILVSLQYYVPHKLSSDFLVGITSWMLIIGSFAFLLGLISLMHMHIAKVRRRTAGWGFSICIFVGIIIGVTCGIIGGGKQLTEAGVMTSFGWMYNHMLNPLQSTMFCLLGFYVVSAAYRSFKIKSKEAAVLLLTAGLFIFARVPLGQYLWESSIGNLLPWKLHEIVEWIMNTPSKAAARGIFIGVSLGMIATAVKILAGIERSYMGGKE